MTFNIHGTKTGDGVVITEGLAVVTNDVEVGRVKIDRDSSCCGDPNDSASQMRVGGVIYTDHDEARDAVAQGCYCSHDHWFEVVLAPDWTRTVLQNGERLATVGYGVNAAKALAELGD